MAVLICCPPTVPHQFQEGRCVWCGIRLISLAVRQFGSSVVHVADPEYGLHMVKVKVMGTEATAIQGKVVCLCGASLNGRMDRGGLVVLMRPDQQATCPKCRERE